MADAADREPWTMHQQTTLKRVDAADPAAESARAVSRTYDRMAPVYDALDAIYEWSWKRRLRAELFRHARGRVLDVGVGTGCNMPFYPAAPRSSASTPAAACWSAPGSGQGAGPPRRPARDEPAPPGLPRRSFDTVAVTFVPALPARRAATPGARGAPPGPEARAAGILILDYHRSSRKHVQFWTKAMARWLQWAFAARFDPATERYLEAAGLEVETRHSFMSDGVTMLCCATPPPPVDRGGGLSVGA
jgi:hypothetical protein